jgi:transposase
MLKPKQAIYLVSGATDMRKSIDGLSLVVSDVLDLNPMSEAWFIFCNRYRDKLKILFWDTNGFWLYYRRLERGRFTWPKLRDGQPVTIERRQLDWLLSGLPLEQPRAHKVLEGMSVR